MSFVLRKLSSAWEAFWDSDLAFVGLMFTAVVLALTLGTLDSISKQSQRVAEAKKITGDPRNGKLLVVVEPDPLIGVFRSVTVFDGQVVTKTLGNSD